MKNMIRNIKRKPRVCPNVYKEGKDPLSLFLRAKGQKGLEPPKYEKVIRA